tara:strand:- start:4902 stop:5891 length:990 start_codon:yes stop_codon:yes gene_type:complete
MKRRDILKFLGFIGVTGFGTGLYHLLTFKKTKKGKTMTKKNIYTIVRPAEKHWVGDGFYVSTLFSPHQVDYQYTTPFILMDHAAPREFAPTQSKLGVGTHPHRGFETVTFAINGEIDHRDSGGGGGTITTGGVQWMTAAKGVVHEEFHSRNFAKTGGVFEMVQLWVNLPAKDKMNSPRYQSMNKEDFADIELTTGVNAKVIAGKLQEKEGPALTHTPINIYEIDAEKPEKINLNFENGSNLLILQLRGSSLMNEKAVNEGEMAIFNRDGDELEIEFTSNAKLLVLNGEPIDEPIVPYGPFVMNTKQEIMQAIDDFNAGKMGQLVEEAKS